MSISERVLIIGTGAQAKYAIEIFTLRKITVLGLISPLSGPLPKSVNSVKVLGSMDDFDNIYLKKKKPSLLFACSSNEMKEELSEKLSGHLPSYINAIHPSSVIASSAHLGNGVIINPNAVIQPDARIGDHVMIHAGVIVEHDCVIGNYVNLAPRVVLAGHVKIGNGTTVYTGAVVIPAVTIGEYSIIGAGSVVIKSIDDKCKVAGIPARSIKGRIKRN